MSTNLVAYRQTYGNDEKGRQVVTQTRVLDTGLTCEEHSKIDRFFHEVYEENKYEIDYDVANESGHEWEFNGNVLMALINYLKETTGKIITLDEDTDIDIDNTTYHVETY